MKSIISAKPKEKFGLLGEKLSHSYSPLVHNCFGDYDYELFETNKSGLEAFYADTSLKGFNVTIPYKVSAYEKCDFLSDTAKRTGSVNTCLRDSSNRLHGYNTDYYGFEKLLEHNNIVVTGKKVTVLGTGGAAKTVCCVLNDRGAKEIVNVSRSGDINYSSLEKFSDSDILVNCTPVGMYPDITGKIISLDPFTRLEAVIDLIYNPQLTPLLIDAKERGITAVNGLIMLLYQAAASSRLFTGKKIKQETVIAAIGIIANSLTNIILVGMPGCGKTTVASTLEKALRKMFRAVDTDEAVLRAHGAAPEEIIKEQGEEKFREYEEEAVEKLCGEHGLVISTGGGAILSEKNRRLFRANGIVVFLQRDIDKLEIAGRPLSRDRMNLYKLYEERLPYYKMCADLVVEVDDNPAVTAERILECLSRL